MTVPISKVAAQNGFVKNLLRSNYISEAFGAGSSSPFPFLLSRTQTLTGNFTVILEIN